MPERTCNATIEDGRGRRRQCQLADRHYDPKTSRHYSALEGGGNIVEWMDEAEFATPASSSPPQPTVRVTRYTVSVLPESDINYRHGAVHVEYEGRFSGRYGEMWSVRNLGAYLWPDGSWREHEYHAWVGFERARDAAVAAIHTTPSALASAVLNHQEQP